MRDQLPDEVVPQVPLPLQSMSTGAFQLVADLLARSRDSQRDASIVPSVQVQSDRARSSNDQEDDRLHATVRRLESQVADYSAQHAQMLAQRSVQSGRLRSAEARIERLHDQNRYLNTQVQFGDFHTVRRRLTPLIDNMFNMSHRITQQCASTQFRLEQAEAQIERLHYQPTRECQQLRDQLTQCQQTNRLLQNQVQQAHFQSL